MTIYNRYMSEDECPNNRNGLLTNIDYIPACNLLGRLAISNEDPNLIGNYELHYRWLTLNINGNKPIFNHIVDPSDYSGEYFYFCHTEEEDKLFFVCYLFNNENEMNELHRTDCLFTKIEIPSVTSYTSGFMDYNIFMTPNTEESLSRFDNTRLSRLVSLPEHNTLNSVDCFNELSSSQFDLHNNSESLSRGNNSSETTQNEEIMTPERYIRCHDYHCKSLEPMIIGDMAKRFTDIVNNKLKELNIL